MQFLPVEYLTFSHKKSLTWSVVNRSFEHLMHRIFRMPKIPHLDNTVHISYHACTLLVACVMVFSLFIALNFFLIIRLALVFFHMP